MKKAVNYIQLRRCVFNIFKLNLMCYYVLEQLYGNIPPVSNTIRERRLRFAGHSWRSKDELSSDLLLWQPRHGKRTPRRPCKTYIDQLAEDIGCTIEDIPTLMQDRENWRKRVKECRVRSTR